MDGRVESMMSEDRFQLLGLTRGVYLEGYGTVFTSEVDLTPSAAPNPFRPALSSKEVASLKEKKRVRIALLKEQLQGMLVSSADSLASVPGDEKIAIAVTIPYYRFEDTGGMPRQALVSAPKKSLIGTPKGQPITGLKIQEFF